MPIDRYPVLPSTRDLVDQQLWYFGHDIRHAEGNALVRFGFRRLRAGNAAGTTCYLLPVTLRSPERNAEHGAPIHADVDGALACWGYATYLGQVIDLALDGNERDLCAAREPSGGPRTVVTFAETGVLLERAAAVPRLVTQALRLPSHRLGELPPRVAPRTSVEWLRALQGLTAMAAIFADYERWARDVLGARHRARALAMVPRHKQRRFLPQSHLVDTWAGLRDSLCVSADAAASDVAFGTSGMVGHHANPLAAQDTRSVA